MFSVEVYLRLQCPACDHTIKRRFLDYLTSRTTLCPNCNVKVVHLSRGQLSDKSNVDVKQLQAFVEQLEGAWSTVVNESLILESKDWSEGGPQL